MMLKSLVIINCFSDNLFIKNSKLTIIYGHQIGCKYKEMEACKRLYVCELYSKTHKLEYVSKPETVRDCQYYCSYSTLIVTTLDSGMPIGASGSYFKNKILNVYFIIMTPWKFLSYGSWYKITFYQR